MYCRITKGKKLFTRIFIDLDRIYDIVLIEVLKWAMIKKDILKNYDNIVLPPIHLKDLI